MTQKSQAWQEMEQIKNIIAPLLGKQSCPSFHVDDEEKPKLTGSGILLKVQEKHFLVTARHVVDEQIRLNSSVYISDGSQGAPLFPISGQVNSSGGAEGKCMVDLSVWSLNDEAVQKLAQFRQFLEPKDMLFGQPSKLAGIFVVYGFPGTEEKRNDEKQSVSARAFYYTTAAKSEGASDGLVIYNPGLHLILKAQDIDFDLGGISGCGVWRVVDPVVGYKGAAACVPQFAGIVIHHPHEAKVIKVLAADVIAAFISDAFPDTLLHFENSGFRRPDFLKSKVEGED